MPGVNRSAPLRFLRTAFQPDDWVAVFLKSYETGRVVQRVGPLSMVVTPRYQAWLRSQNARRYNVYIAWNWVAVPFFSPDASSVVVQTSERQSDKEVRMTDQDVRWEQYPRVSKHAVARAWLGLQANRNLAKHSVETYGRSLDDFLRFMEQETVRPEAATREQLAAYVRDLLGRTNPRQPNVVRL